jgi:hypothetical protein
MSGGVTLKMESGNRFYMRSYPETWSKFEVALEAFTGIYQIREDTVRLIFL